MVRLYYIFMISLFYLGCGFQEKDINDEFDNPLGNADSDCGLPALIFKPSIHYLVPNEEFSAPLFLSDSLESDQLYGGFRATVFFDPNVLDLRDVRSRQFNENVNSMFFVDSSESGRIEVVGIFIDQVNLGAEGSNNVEIAEFDFKVIGAGNDTLRLSRTFVEDCQTVSEGCELVDPDDNIIEIKSYTDAIIRAN
tara:strand:+ start:2463 stop:3047 length:585 start_codon:yes stop_codon:yes gene_type:complete